MENRSLDDFLADRTENGDRPDDSDSNGRDETDPSTRGANTTSRWTAGGRACPDCGASVMRLWAGDESLVCGDCKDWT